jgi:hypothetical protein
MLPRAYLTSTCRRGVVPAAAADAPAGAGGSRRYRVTIRQPLGIVLAEDAKNGRIVVEEVVSGGNAARDGRVAVGYGARPYDNWERIWVDAVGLQYETVMSALSSNNPRWGISSIELELEQGVL